MMTFPFSAPIEKALEWWVNGKDVLMALPPTVVIIRPSGQEQFIYSQDPQTDREKQVVAVANATWVFTGPGEDDWKQVITSVYDRDGCVIYETDIAPYLEAAASAYERYIQDEDAPGIKRYYPENGERRPAGRIEVFTGHYGDSYIRTVLTLKGRGIKLREDEGGCNTYSVTELALGKLREKYSIVRALNYD